MGLTLGVGLGNNLSATSSEGPTDYEVKAAFLANFSRYVKWPTEVEAEADQPIVIGFLKSNKVSEAIEAILESRPPGGRRIVTRIIAAIDQVEDCHILYIGDGEAQRFPSIIKTLSGTGILTVGDSTDFLDQGGIISLVLRHSRVRVDINLEGARESNLEISSKLLAVADVVKGRD